MVMKFRLCAKYLAANIPPPKNVLMSSTHVQINYSQGRSHKMRTRFCISSSTNFKLCQVCWDDIRFKLMTS